MPTVTLADLSGRVYSRIDNNTQLYTQSEVTSSLNESLRVMNSFLCLIQTSVHVPGLSVAGRVWYHVPSPVLIPIRVQFEGGYLQKMFPSQIGKAYSNWVEDSTLSTGMPVSEWVPCGLSKFAIHPADSIGGGLLTVTGVQDPVPLVNPTDTVTIPQEYTDVLVNLSGQVLTLKETGKLFGQQIFFYREFMRLMAKAAIWRGAVMPLYSTPETRQRN